MTKATILVVEDEPNLLMMGIKDVLLEADYNVLTAENADDAIEQLNQHTVDIVVAGNKLHYDENLTYSIYQTT